MMPGDNSMNPDLEPNYKWPGFRVLWASICQLTTEMGSRSKMFFACALVAIWCFPEIWIRQQIWSSAEQRWVTMEETFEHQFVATASYGEKPIGFSSRSQTGETVLAWMKNFPEHRFTSTVQRKAEIAWIPQFSITALWAFVAAGTGMVQSARRAEKFMQGR